jgi:ferredoxin
MKELRLRVDPVFCDGHGICAELLPELIRLDDWGYPIISGEPFPASMLDKVRRTITACPVLALRIERTSTSAGPNAPQSGASRTRVRDETGSSAR